jgi:hypothetical protein
MGSELLTPRISVSVETSLTFRRMRGLKRIREKEFLLDAMAEDEKDGSALGLSGCAEAK